MSKAELSLDNGVLMVSGELDKTSVPQVAKDSGRWFSQIKDDIIVNLSGLSRADSSGLAMLVEWMRMARERQRGIRFQQVPDQLLAIATVSGLNEMLPLDN